MLRCILIALVLAICSTFLVRPWFWKGLIKKDLFNHDGEKVGFNFDWKSDVKNEIVIFIVIFILTLLSFSLFGARQNIYGVLHMVVMCIMAQCLWAYQSKAFKIACFIIVLAILGFKAHDLIVSETFKVPFNKVEYSDLNRIEKAQDNHEDSGADLRFFSSPTYNNGKYIFTCKGGKTGQGVFIIDTNESYNSLFIPCKYMLKEDCIKKDYPTQKIKELYITVSNENIPFGFFAIADRELFGPYKVTGYVLLNLINGDIQYYEEQQLPEFVKN